MKQIELNWNDSLEGGYITFLSVCRFSLYTHIYIFKFRQKSLRIFGTMQNVPHPGPPSNVTPCSGPGTQCLDQFLWKILGTLEPLRAQSPS